MHALRKGRLKALIAAQTHYDSPLPQLCKSYIATSAEATVIREIAGVLMTRYKLV